MTPLKIWQDGIALARLKHEMAALFASSKVGAFGFILIQRTWSRDCLRNTCAVLRS